MKDWRRFSWWSTTGPVWKSSHLLVKSTDKHYKQHVLKNTLKPKYSTKLNIKSRIHWNRVPTHFLKSFSILFQYLFNTKFKKFNTITSLHFSKFLIMKLKFTHCTTLHKYRGALPSVKFCSDTWDFFSIKEFPYFFNTKCTFW